MKSVRIVAITLVVLTAVAAAVVYSGSFNIAADDPYWGMTSRLIETLRDRSISRQAKDAGDLAWIATESQLKTEGSKPLELLTTETMVLKRTPEGWRVMHIHWASRAKK
jgi:ketosteroid isomerase-like protein